MIASHTCESASRAAFETFGGGAEARIRPVSQGRGVFSVQVDGVRLFDSDGVAKACGVVVEFACLKDVIYRPARGDVSGVVIKRGESDVVTIPSRRVGNVRRFEPDTKHFKAALDDQKQMDAITRMNFLRVGTRMLRYAEGQTPADMKLSVSQTSALDEWEITSTGCVDSFTARHMLRIHRELPSCVKRVSVDSNGVLTVLVCSGTNSLDRDERRVWEHIEEALGGEIGDHLG